MGLARTEIPAQTLSVPEDAASHAFANNQALPFPQRTAGHIGEVLGIDDSVTVREDVTNCPRFLQFGQRLWVPKTRSWALTCNDASRSSRAEMTGSGAYAASLPPILICTRPLAR